MAQNTRTGDLTSGPMLQKIILFSLPLAASSILQLLFFKRTDYSKRLDAVVHINHVINYNNADRDPANIIQIYSSCVIHIFPPLQLFLTYFSI